MRKSRREFHRSHVSGNRRWIKSKLIKRAIEVSTETLRKKLKQKEVISMKKLLVVSCLLLVVVLAGCAHLDPAGPRNEREAFPTRNQDPRWGLLVNEGTTHLELFIYDGADRLVEQTYVAGVNRFFRVNGQTLPHYSLRQLEFGNYRLELYPFYYQINIVGPLFGRPFRYRVDLPKQAAGIVVGRNPTANYDAGYSIGGTYRHWGWICRLNGGNIPETAHGLPGVTLDIIGNFGGR